MYLKKLVASFVLIASLVIFSGSMLAHHGNVAYDEIHPITIAGTVTEVVWANPHVQIFLDVKDDKGKIVSWVSNLKAPAFCTGMAGTRVQSSRETR